MIRVLVVEDDRLAAEAHRLYVQRVAGFEVAGVVHSAAEAFRFCKRDAVDVILLDFRLPDVHGLAVCRALRAAGSAVDVIAVTAQRDLAAVRDALSLGVVHYLVKPFAFASLRDKLESYAQFRRRVARPGQVASQDDVDDIWNQRRPMGLDRILPKGMSGETLRAITTLLTGAAQGLSAAVAASALGVSRVTARRYLEFLADNGLAQRKLHYGQVGRPELWFYPIRSFSESEAIENSDGDDNVSPC